MIENFDPYKVLGVNKDASIDDIKKSFKNRIKSAHPDYGGSSEDFDVIKRAYDILTDAVKRKMWDEYRLANDLDIENEARLVASQIAVQILDTCPNDCNFDKEMAEVFEECLKNISFNIQNLTERKERLEKRLEAICKKPADDFLSIDFERTVNDRDIQIRQQKLNLEIHKRAFELIREYKFCTERLADIFDPFRSRHNFLSTKSEILEGIRKTLEKPN
jgi:DnaJ-class molecular chaperone